MKIRTLILVIALTSIIAFVALNWSSVISPTNLSLGIAGIDAPYGFFILGLLTLFSLSFFALNFYSKTEDSGKKRQQMEEPPFSQEITDKVKALQIIEMREQLSEKLKKQTDLYSNLSAAMLTRLEQLDNILRSTTEELGNGFLASNRPNQINKTGE